MTPDVVVDIGNSRIKWGRCEAGRVAGMVSLPLDSPERWIFQAVEWKLPSRTSWAMAGVNPAVQATFRDWIHSDGGTVAEIADYRQIPLKVAVESPERVGIDRLVTALAAQSLTQPRPAIAFNIGTAITADLVDGSFRGGAILPGPQLMARSLNEFTAKLPLVDASNLHTLYCPGTDTLAAIQLGIGSAVFGAVKRLIEAYSQLLDQSPIVFFTGGGMAPFTNVETDATWTSNPDDTRFVPTLTLEGIRLAAEAL